MIQMIDEPIIQSLGYNGERFRLKVVFPIHRLEIAASRLDDAQPAITDSLGRYSAILAFRAEDLPRHSSDRDELIVIDVGQLFQHKMHKG